MVTVTVDTATCPDVTSMVATVELSELFLIKMLPVPLAMFSSKVSTRLAPMATPVALSVGL